MRRNTLTHTDVTAIFFINLEVTVPTQWPMFHCCFLKSLVQMDDTSSTYPIYIVVLWFTWYSSDMPQTSYRLSHTDCSLHFNRPISHSVTCYKPSSCYLPAYIRFESVTLCIMWFFFGSFTPEPEKNFFLPSCGFFGLFKPERSISNGASCWVWRWCILESRTPRVTSG